MPTEQQRAVPSEINPIQTITNGILHASKKAKEYSIDFAMD